MQKLYAESHITSKINTHYGSPSTSRYNHGPYQKISLQVPTSSSRSKPLQPPQKNSIITKIAFLIRFFIQIKLIQNKIIFILFLKEPRELPPLSSIGRVL